MSTEAIFEVQRAAQIDEEAREQVKAQQAKLEAEARAAADEAARIKSEAAAQAGARRTQSGSFLNFAPASQTCYTHYQAQMCWTQLARHLCNEPGRYRITLDNSRVMPSQIAPRACRHARAEAGRGGGAQGGAGRAA
jgi:hypothetical protein